MNINIKQKIGMKQRLYHMRVQYSTEVSKYTTVYRLDSKTLATYSSFCTFDSILAGLGSTFKSVQCMLLFTNNP